jgi:hypothetical protein
MNRNWKEREKRNLLLLPLPLSLHLPRGSTCCRSKPRLALPLGLDLSPIPMEEVRLFLQCTRIREHPTQWLRITSNTSITTSNSSGRSRVEGGGKVGRRGIPSAVRRIQDKDKGMDKDKDKDKEAMEVVVLGGGRDHLGSSDTRPSSMTDAINKL